MVVVPRTKVALIRKVLVIFLLNLLSSSGCLRTSLLRFKRAFWHGTPFNIMCQRKSHKKQVLYVMILIRRVSSGYARRTYITIVSLEKFGYSAKLPEWSGFYRILNQHTPFTYILLLKSIFCMFFQISLRLKKYSSFHDSLKLSSNFSLSERAEEV